MHIEGPSLTRQSGFSHEFWLHYDRVKMYHRLRTLRANVSLAAYAAACLVTRNAESSSHDLRTDALNSAMARGARMNRTHHQPSTSSRA